MIHFIDDSAIAYKASGEVRTVQLHESLDALEAGAPNARLELLIWGLIAATRAQTQAMTDQVEQARAAAPDIDTLVSKVVTELPKLVEQLGGAGGATVAGVRQLFPQEQPAPPNGEG